MWTVHTIPPLQQLGKAAVWTEHTIPPLQTQLRIQANTTHEAPTRLVRPLQRPREVYGRPQAASALTTATGTTEMGGQGTAGRPHDQPVLLSTSGLRGAPAVRDLMGFTF